MTYDLHTYFKYGRCFGIVSILLADTEQLFWLVSRHLAIRVELSSYCNSFREMYSQGVKIGSVTKWQQNILDLWSYSVLSESFKVFMERNFTANGRDIWSNAKKSCYWEGTLVRLLSKNVNIKIRATVIYLLFYMDTKLGLSHTERSQSTYLRIWCYEIIWV
jgi:hypothetical protein